MLGDDDMVGDDRAAHARYVQRLERELARLRGERVTFPFVVEDAKGNAIEVHEGLVVFGENYDTRPTPNQARALARALMQAADAAEGRDDDNR